jgi:methylated-DNA-[protein]-cysteine S-methyltransferase
MAAPQAVALVPTPYGSCLEITTRDGCIVAAEFRRRRLPAAQRITNPVLKEAAAQVKAYFAKRLPVFDLPLHFEGKPFENEVWRAVSTLQFGHFVSYAEVGHAIGRPRTHRLVAAAMGKTPIDLFVPAHRVIGADGKLKGCDPASVRYKLAVFEGYGATDRRRTGATPA